MPSNFADASGKVIVVDPSGPVRQLLTDVVRSLGFNDVQGCANIKDTFNLLEVEVASWVLAPLMVDQDVNLMHLLKIATVHPVLSKLRISALLEESEDYVIPKAFELGMLSWHRKPFTKDSLAEEFTNFKKLLESTEYNEPLTAGFYLRKHLTQAKLNGPLLELEKALVGMNPGNLRAMLDLARAQGLNGDKTSAKATLRQVKLIDKSFEQEAQTIGNEVLGEGGLDAGDAGGSVNNMLGLKSVVIVDSDDAVRQSVTEICQSLGVESVQTFPDGEQAAEWVEKNPEPDAIIHEWRIPKLSGPLLIQRIRQAGHLAVPLIVVSSLIKPEDLPLVKEMGVANLIQKPLVREKFLSSLVWTIRQERQPTNHQSLERKSRQLLQKRKFNEAKQFLAKLVEDKTVADAHKLRMEAELAYYQDNFEEAKANGIEALKKAGDSILLLNLLGKTFMKLHDYQSSLKCFKKAQELSPKNIERLCNIAECHSEMGDDAAAQQSLDNAKSMDKNNKVVQQTEASKAIKSGDVNAAKRIMNEMESVSNFVAYMNNKAVAHARCGFVEEGIDLYHKTLKAIADDRRELIPIVRYNLALAQVRAGDLEVAVAELKKSLQDPKSKVAKKAASLRERLEKAIQSGAEFTLRADEVETGDPAALEGKKPDAPAPDSKAAKAEAKKAEAAKIEEIGTEKQEIMAAIGATAGEFCCFKVFYDPAGKDSKATPLLENLPRFQHRGAIARNEAMGAEKTLKAS
jgi:CheY-like chemotaxis protein